MLLIDTGAIADLKRKMAPEIQPMPQAPIQAPLLAQAPPPQMPLLDQPDPIRSAPMAPKPSLWSKINSAGRPDLPPEVASLLTPEQQQRATSGGLLQRVGLQVLGGGMFTPAMQARWKADRILNDQATKDQVVEAASLKEQMAALRKKHAGGDFRQFAAELAMLRPELAGPLSGMVNAMEPPRAVNPPSAPALQREDNVLGEDGKPYIVWTDAQGKEVKRERQYVAPQAPREDNTIVPVLDPADPEKKRVIYVPRAQAVGMERPSAGAGGINGQAVTNRLVAENDKQIGVIDSALSELRKYPKAVGMNRGLGLVPGMGNFADEFNQRRDPEGVKLRALIANISSLKIKDRSGAAVTISEFPRLVPFIPLVTNTPEAIKTKLEQLKAEIALHNKELRQESGGGVAAKVPSFEEWKAGRKP